MGETDKATKVRATELKTAYTDVHHAAAELGLAVTGQSGRLGVNHTCKVCGGEASLFYSQRHRVLLDKCPNCEQKGDKKKKGETRDIIALAVIELGLPWHKAVEWLEASLTRMPVADDQQPLIWYELSEDDAEWLAIENAGGIPAALAGQECVGVLRPEKTQPEYAQKWLEDGQTLILETEDASGGNDSGYVAINPSTAKTSWGKAGRHGVVCNDGTSGTTRYVVVGDWEGAKLLGSLSKVYLVPPGRPGNLDPSDRPGAPTTHRQSQLEGRFRAIAEKIPADHTVQLIVAPISGEPMHTHADRVREYMRIWALTGRKVDVGAYESLMALMRKQLRALAAEQPAATASDTVVEHDKPAPGSPEDMDGLLKGLAEEDDGSDDEDDLDDDEAADDDLQDDDDAEEPAPVEHVLLVADPAPVPRLALPAPGSPADSAELLGLLALNPQPCTRQDPPIPVAVPERDTPVALPPPQDPPIPVEQSPQVPPVLMEQPPQVLLATTAPVQVAPVAAEHPAGTASPAPDLMAQLRELVARMDPSQEARALRFLLERAPAEDPPAKAPPPVLVPVLVAAPSVAPAQRSDAADFIRRFLEDGPIPGAEVSKAARAAGYSTAAIKEAKANLRIFVTAGSPWIWSLPAPPSHRPQVHRLDSIEPPSTIIPKKRSICAPQTWPESTRGTRYATRGILRGSRYARYAMRVVRDATRGRPLDHAMRVASRRMVPPARRIKMNLPPARLYKQEQDETERTGRRLPCSPRRFSLPSDLLVH